MSEQSCCSCSGCDCDLESTEQKLLERLDEMLPEYISKPGGLIPALQMTQRLFGYLPEGAIKKVSAAFDKPYSEVAAVVSFYSFFSTVPRGKYVVRVCLGTACYVRGGKEVLESLRKNLGIEVGQTTSDRQFSLDVGRCFGACGLAPVVMVNDDTHHRVKPGKVNEILAAYSNLEASVGE
jgi:NADH:ubiquinone oxidoreductase subunit E